MNPAPYPVGAIPPEAWHRLPGPDAIRALEAAAGAAYGALDPTHVIAAPGTQALIQWLPRLFPARSVGVLGFSYGEHARVWAASGARVERVEAVEGLATFDVAVVVNPNNPDGRLVPPGALHDLASAMARRGGLLVVDEAFVDVIRPSPSLVPRMPRAATVVLRSFGKIYGLGGLRLGFAIASTDLSDTIRAAIGPWGVSGPALTIGRAALADADWLDQARTGLIAASARLDGLLQAAGLQVVGGTPLFRLVQSPAAPAVFEHLLRAGILTRPFAHRPDWLRFGVCGDAAAWERLKAALLGH